MYLLVFLSFQLPKKKKKKNKHHNCTVTTANMPIYRFPLQILLHNELLTITTELQGEYEDDFFSNILIFKQIFNTIWRSVRG